jgi:hypothetical protein
VEVGGQGGRRPWGVRTAGGGWPAAPRVDLCNSCMTV